MRIEFCSLCDESVPLPDLDKGIAVKTKGRIICANCESAMSREGEAQPASPLQFMGSQPVEGEALQSGGDTTVMDNSQEAKSRPRRGTAQDPVGGMLFAAFTLLVIGGLMAGFHFYDQYKLERGFMQAEMSRLSALMDESVAIQNRRVRGAVGEATRELPAALAKLNLLESSLAAQAQQRSEDQAAWAAELDGLKQKLTRVDVLLERLDGNEQDLELVAASLADVFDDVLGLKRRLDSAEAIADAMPASTEALEEPDAPAAWLGHVSELEDADPGTRWLAVTAIGEFGDPSCAPHLTPRLEDEDVFVRMAAARILGEVRAFSAIESLIDALEDEQNTVRQAAMLALRSLTGESLKFDADEKPAVRQKRVNAWREWWSKNKKNFETP